MPRSKSIVKGIHVYFKSLNTCEVDDTNFVESQTVFKKSEHCYSFRDYLCRNTAYASLFAFQPEMPCFCFTRLEGFDSPIIPNLLGSCNVRESNDHHVIQNLGTFFCAPVTILNHGNKKARKLITCQRTEKNKQAIATHSKKHHGNVRQLCQKIS